MSRSGRPRTKVYSPEAERLLAELAADVRAGRLASTSPEYQRRWHRAAKGLPGAGTPRAPRAKRAARAQYDGFAAPREGTLIEQAARAIQRVRPCTFTEAAVAAMGWRIDTV